MAMTQEQLMASVEAAVQQRLAAAGFGGGTNDRAGGLGRRRIQEMGHYCANFRLRCDTIDDSGGSTQRHDDEDKCAK